MKRTFPPAITGKFFNTASQRLVLDSFNARQSDGIYFEFRIHQEQLIDGEYLYYKEKKGESFNLFRDLPPIEEEENNRKKKTLSKAELYQKAWKEQERKEIRYRLEISGGITINDTPEIIEKKIEKKIEYLNKNRKPLIDQYIRSSKFKK